MRVTPSQVCGLKHILGILIKRYQVTPSQVCGLKQKLSIQYYNVFRHTFTGVWIEANTGSILDGLDPSHLHRCVD